MRTKCTPMFAVIIYFSFEFGGLAIFSMTVLAGLIFLN